MNGQVDKEQCEILYIDIVNLNHGGWWQRWHFEMPFLCFLSLLPHRFAKQVKALCTSLLQPFSRALDLLWGNIPRCFFTLVLLPECILITRHISKMAKKTESQANVVSQKLPEAQEEKRNLPLLYLPRAIWIMGCGTGSAELGGNKHQNFPGLLISNRMDNKDMPFSYSCAK